MPNNTRTQTDGTWVDGYTPPASDWEDLERKIFGSWNGDKGGAYCAPGATSGTPGVGSTYSIAGSGLQVTGPTRLSYGGALKGGTGAFVLRDGSWPTFGTTHSGRSRSIVCPIDAWSLAPPSDALYYGDTRPSRSYLWSRNHPYAGVGSVALSCRQTNSRTIETAELYIPLRVIDGSVLEKVALHFRVASKRLLAPIAMPKMRILRMPRDSGDTYQTKLPVPLKDTTDGLGFDFLPLVTSPVTWFNNGEVQTFEYVCDQNNVIDVENYSYVVHLVEETGALKPDDPFDGICYVERKLDVYLVGTNALTLSGSVAIDGSSATAGSRVLITDSDDVLLTGEPTAFSPNNGIWLAAAGAWARDNDADEAEDFTPNWIVIASAGGINARCTWQCVYPSSSQRIKFGTTCPRIQPAEPKGNIYHALVPTFTVSDLRFQ